MKYQRNKLGQFERGFPHMNLVIECDGDYWHKYPKGREIDKIRTNEIKEKGIKILRFWEHEIKNMNIDNFTNVLLKD